MDPTLNVILHQPDWSRFEEEVLLAVEDAVRHYVSGRKGSSGETVCQASIWTDPQLPMTSIGFETLAHASARGGVFVKESTGDGAPTVEQVGHVFPSEFAFREFRCVYHPQMTGLLSLDFANEHHVDAALQRIEASLVRVRDAVVAAKVLDALPRAPRLLLGVNSPRDWYDHVIAV